MWDLNELVGGLPEGWILSDATAINDLGQIVGTGLYQGQERAYLLTPTDFATAPEPGTMLLIGLGFAGVCRARPRRGVTR
jgi:probable HAF family extracellular repeat protein